MRKTSRHIWNARRRTLPGRWNYWPDHQSENMPEEQVGRRDRRGPAVVGAIAATSEGGGRHGVREASRGDLGTSFRRSATVVAVVGDRARRVLGQCLGVH